MEAQKGLKIFHTTFRPRFSDFDLQGVMHQRQYLDLLAEARIDQMEKNYKIPLETYVKKNQHWVAARVDISFLNSIVIGKKVIVATSVFKIEGSKAFVSFRFFPHSENEDGSYEKIYAEGIAEYVLINLKTKTPIAISEEDKAVYL